MTETNKDMKRRQKRGVLDTIRAQILGKTKDADDTDRDDEEADAPE